MTEPNLEYRIWQRGRQWHWQVLEVMDDVQQFIASGVASSDHAARIAALAVCLKYQSDAS